MDSNRKWHVEVEAEAYCKLLRWKPFLHVPYSMCPVVDNTHTDSYHVRPHHYEHYYTHQLSLKVLKLSDHVLASPHVVVGVTTQMEVVESWVMMDYGVEVIVEMDDVDNNIRSIVQMDVAEDAVKNWKKQCEEGAVV